MINKQEILLQADNILVRPLKVTDVSDEYIAGLNDPDVNRYLVAVRQHRQTKESVTRYVEADGDNPLSILFGIFVKKDENPFVGTLRVHNIDFFHFSASIGVCLFAKRAWKRGYACHGLRLIKKYLFEDVKLHYLEAGVYAENVDSIACFLNAGFVEQYRINNKYRHIDSFEEVIFFAAINPLFDSSLLK
ncbi:MAG: GNAT family N-acetyltransferase [Deltaproteobacteria bacterium]|nr:GNAT family N-acetyltransferase [Deltaproteobacteria bacterium]